MTRAATENRDTRFLAEAAILGEFVAELQSNAGYVAREIDTAAQARGHSAETSPRRRTVEPNAMPAVRRDIIHGT